MRNFAALILHSCRANSACRTFYSRKSAESVSIIMVKNSLGTIYFAINNVIARSSRTFGTCFIQRPLGYSAKDRGSTWIVKIFEIEIFWRISHILLYHHKFSSSVFTFIALIKIFMASPKYFPAYDSWDYWRISYINVTCCYNVIFSF